MKNQFKSTIKKVLLVLLAILLLFQFYRPAKNISSGTSINALDQHYPVPQNVSRILSTSCNDCHSNNTKYPWYGNIQPVALWLEDHIKDGKKHLNFDEFNTYAAERKVKKLREIIEVIDEDEMPLSSYTIVHRDASLSPEDKKILTDWVNELLKK